MEGFLLLGCELLWDVRKKKCEIFSGTKGILNNDFNFRASIVQQA